MKAVFIFLAAELVSSFLYGQPAKVSITDSLELVQLTSNVWQHITLQYYPAFGTFTSNGLIYRSGNEAVIMDTPASPMQSKALLDWWTRNYPDTRLRAVIVNHFHEDALGGLAVFHQAGIASYANQRTNRLLRQRHPTAVRARNTFKTEEAVKVGNQTVINFYPGPAHTHDNIVTWIPEEKVLFGGCMVKSVGAGKGNVADADLKRWTATINKVIGRYPEAAIVVPGHGPVGDRSLLRYTADLFAEYSRYE